MADDMRPHADPLEGVRQVILQHILPGTDFADAQIGEWPSTDLDSKLPYISLDEVNSNADFLRNDVSMAIDVFCEFRSEAIRLAGLIDIHLLAQPRGVNLDGHWFRMDDVYASRSPRPEEWDVSEKIRRQSGIYEFSVRR